VDRTGEKPAKFGKKDVAERNTSPTGKPQIEWLAFIYSGFRLGNKGKNWEVGVQRAY